MVLDKTSNSISGSIIRRIKLVKSKFLILCLTAAFRNKYLDINNSLYLFYNKKKLRILSCQSCLSKNKKFDANFKKFNKNTDFFFMIF
jgi:hypothetical protein